MTAPLRVAVLGAGTVGREVVRALLERGDAAPDGRRGAARARRRRRPRHRRGRSPRGIPEALLTDAPAHLVADPGRRRRRRAHGRRRAGPDAHRGRARRRQAGRDREQARPRPPRSGARGDRPADGRGAPLRGRRRRRHPGPRAARRRPRRERDRARPRASSTGRRTTSSTEMADEGVATPTPSPRRRRAGYAEADPTGDVEGHDAVNKLVDPRPPRVRRLARSRRASQPQRDGRAGPGITGVTAGGPRRGERGGPGDQAPRRGGARTTGLPRHDRGGRLDRRPVPVVRARPGSAACPTASRSTPRRSVGSAFSGPGAGGAATASAVLGDLLAIARGGGSTWAGLPRGRPRPRCRPRPRGVVHRAVGRPLPGRRRDRDGARPAAAPDGPLPGLVLPITDATPGPVARRGRSRRSSALAPLRRAASGSRTCTRRSRGPNPTGSFKDRGMVVAVAKAVEAGARSIICASTGNTSASAAAYGAAAGLEVVVVLPKGAIALGKLLQALVAGAPRRRRRRQLRRGAGASSASWRRGTTTRSRS